MTKPTIQPLITELQEIGHLSGISSLLSWDQETYMPHGAIESRSEQSALIAKISHQRLTSKKFSEILNSLIDLKTEKIKLNSLTESEKKLIQLVHKEWKKNTALPTEFVTEWSKLTTKAQHNWQIAREKNKFALFAPYLKKLVQLSKEKASLIDKISKPYNVLLDDFEPEVTTDTLTPLFAKLKENLTTILPEIIKKQKKISVNTPSLSIQKQWDFGIEVLKAMGYDFKYGRQDKSTHPFTTHFHPTDVRITTRLSEKSFLEGFSSTVHEGGHGLYEQGLNPNWFGTPLGQACSLGIHESQSRLWENQIGKSKPFWLHFYPKLKNYFPTEFQSLELDSFYHWINQVSPGLIRVEADEVTYNLHILIRYEIEQLLFNENTNIEELPKIWNSKYEKYLGIKPTNDANGILQDVHWSCGLFGYFPTYTLGNLYAAQLYEHVKKTIPNFETHIKTGNLIVLTNWLKQNIFSYGQLKNAETLIKELTGQSLSEIPFINYLTNKYLK